MHGKHVVTALCDKVCDEKREGSKAYHDKRYQPVVPKHKAKRADYRHDAAEKLREALYQAVGDLVYVVADPRHKVAVRVRINVGEGNVVEFCVRARAKVSNGAEGRKVYAQRREILEHEYARDEPCEYACVFENNLEVYVVFANDIVDGFAYDDGRKQRRRYLQRRKDERKYNDGHVRACVSQQFFDCRKIRSALLRIGIFWRADSLEILRGGDSVLEINVRSGNGVRLSINANLSFNGRLGNGVHLRIGVPFDIRIF